MIFKNHIVINEQKNTIITKPSISCELVCVEKQNLYKRKAVYTIHTADTKRK